MLKNFPKNILLNLNGQTTKKWCEIINLNMARIPRVTHEVSKDPVLCRIMDVLRQRKRTNKDLEKYLHLANGTFNSWKFKGIKSYLTHIREIAEFLNVSTNYLFNGSELDVKSEEITATELEIIQMFRKVDLKGQECILEILKRFVR